MNEWSGLDEEEKPMEEQTLHAVTGAFGYSGKYIAQRLLDANKKVITLTNSLHRENPFGESVRAFPLSFDDPEKLRSSLQGVRVLYNTYWVRFNYKTFTHSAAISNTFKLFSAAKDAGVCRVVHVSITNPSEESPLEYFRGKAILERELIDSGLSYSILRPTVLFGREDILINNIAWALRRFPFFGLFGDGSYRIQPIYVDDLASIAVEHGEQDDNLIIDAIGPETFTFRELVEVIGRIIECEKPAVPLPPRVAHFMISLIGKAYGDVTITWEEVLGLMDNLLYVDSPAAGQTKLTDWAMTHKEQLGLTYANELQRRVAINP